MNTGGPARAVVALLAAVVALTLQVSVLPFFAWQGVVPNLVLLVVVATALTCGSELAMSVGFAAGLLLDLAPPADHVAGRWALALVVVGWIAGYVRGAAPTGPLGTLGVVLASSFVGTSLFALSGVVLHDPGVGVGELLGSVLLALVADTVLAPLVVLPTARLLRRTQRERAYA